MESLNFFEETQRYLFKIQYFLHGTNKVPIKVKLERVLSIGQIETVVRMANEIWTEHYTSIIGKSQVEYMLSNFQSKDIIKNVMSNKSVHYYLIYNTNKIIGYAGLNIEESQLFLSKIYILSCERGKGIGNKSIELIKEIALTNNLKVIYLTVNKMNVKTIATYQNMGFKITEEISADIGEGYLMDDFKMELKLK